MLPPRPAGPARCDYNPRMSATGRAPRARLALCLLLAAPLAAQAPPVLRARLAPVPIDVAMQATIAGQGTATATLSGTTLSVEGSYQGLVTPATTVRVYESARMGMRGTLVGEFPSGGGTSGTLQGHRDALAARRPRRSSKGLLYVQIQSEKAPDGNLWGWLDATEGTTLMTRRTHPARLVHSRRRRGRRSPSPGPWPRLVPPPARRRRPARRRLHRGAGRRRPRPLPGPLRRLPPRRPGRPQRRAAAGRRHLLRRVARPDHARAGRVHPRLDAAGRPAARRRRRRRRHRLHPRQQRRRCRRHRAHRGRRRAGGLGGHRGRHRRRADRGRARACGSRAARQPAVGLHRAAAAAAHRRPAAPRALRGRRGAALHAGHRRDAAHAAARRLADGAPHLPGVEPQPAHRDHPGQRRLAAAGLGVEHERGRLQPADAARARRHPLPHQHAERGAGARRRHRRSHLGQPGRPQPPRHRRPAGCATSPSTTTRSSSPPPTPRWSPSTRAPARWCGPP